MAWTFFEYVGSNDRGVVRDWFKRLPHGTSQQVEAAVDALVEELQQLTCDVFDRSHNVGQLRHSCSDYFELRVKVQKVQYRPIGFYGPARREFTLLGITTEKGGVLVDDQDCSRIKERRKSILNRSHIREYL